jgi:glycosyltransferase involved in cell wall biosynthesis
MDGSFLMLPPSGTGTYVRELTAALRELEPSLDLQVLLPRWDDRPSGAMPRGMRLDRLRRDRRLRRAVWELTGVARAARADRPDLLHIPHFSAPVRPGVPLVVTIHDVIPLTLPEYRASPAMRLHLAAIRRTVRSARRVLTPSRAAADDVARVLGFPVERIRVTPEAAAPSLRPPTDPASAHEAVRRFGVRGRYVFNVGGLDVRKNLPVLIEAFAIASARLDEPLQLVIAGSPHSGNPAVFPPLEPVLRRFGVEKTTILPGRISEADKLALYQAADLYVTPSLYEGFGLTALEAMACGVPTIAANRTSLPEVVGDGGLLVEPRPEAVAAAMVDVLSNPDRTAALRARGLSRARCFTWRRTAELTLDVYREVLSELTRRPGGERTS